MWVCVCVCVCVTDCLRSGGEGGESGGYAFIGRLEFLKETNTWLLSNMGTTYTWVAEGSLYSCVTLEENTLDKATRRKRGNSTAGWLGSCC